MSYQTYFGSLDKFEKGTIELINDKAKHYAFSNIFEVASRSKPYEKVVVAKNLKYVIATLPKWTKSSVCYTFLTRVTQLLESSGLPNQDWIRVFPYLVEDINSGKWINDNILIKGLNWKDACEAFTSHFQASDYHITLQQDFNKCRQHAHESAQTYGDNLRDLCSQLGYADDNKLVIEHFVSRLLPPLRQRYHDSVATTRLAVRGFQVISLKHAIDICIELDTATRSAHIASEATSL